MKCGYCRKKISPFIDNELDEKEAADVRAHIDSCDSCREVYARYKKLDMCIEDTYERVELREDMRSDIVDSIFDSVNKNSMSLEYNFHQPKKSHPRYANRRRFLHIYEKQIKGGVAAIFLLLIFIFAFIKPGFFYKIGAEKTAQNGMYLSEKHFDSMEKAAEFIKEIPFVVPAKVPQGYNLKEVSFYKDFQSKCRVLFLYEDKDYNELEVQYYQKDEVPTEDIMSIDNKYVKIEAVESMGCPKPVEKAKGNVPMTSKSIKLDLMKYGFAATLRYNSKVPDEDKSGDMILHRIADRYLGSSICTITADYQSGKSKYENSKYKTYEELKKDLPSGINIVEPSYVPEDFKLKEITYRKVFKDFFIVQAIYSGYYGEFIIDYRLSGKGWVGSDPGKIESNELYSIVLYLNGEKKAALKPGIRYDKDEFEILPQVEKRISASHKDFDLNIVMRIRGLTRESKSRWDDEIIKIRDGIVKN